MCADASPPIGPPSAARPPILCRGTRERSGLDVSEYPAVERWMAPPTAARGATSPIARDVDAPPSELPFFRAARHASAAGNARERGL